MMKNLWRLLLLAFLVVINNPIIVHALDKEVTDEEIKQAILAQSASYDEHLDNIASLEEYRDSLTEAEKAANKKETEEIKSISQIINYHKRGRIVFDAVTMMTLRNYWESEYLKYEKSTRRIIERREAYREELEIIFRKEGVPIEFINIASTETAFLDEISPAGAEGVFQFTSKTGRAYGLLIDKEEGIDERHDVFKSGRAAAKYLKDLYAKFENWSLVLAAYNGTFVWLYSSANSGGDLSYEGYLDFREDRVNEVRDSIREGNPVDCSVRFGDNLWKFSMRYRVPVKDIMVANGLSSDIIHSGTKLKIPILDDKHAAHVFAVEMRDTVENTRYPEKFYGFLAADRKIAEMDNKQLAMKK